MFCEGTVELQLNLFALHQIKRLGASERTLVSISFDAVDTFETEHFFALSSTKIRLLCDIVANGALVLFCLFVNLYKLLGFECFHIRY